MSRDEVTSLIDARVSEALSKHMLIFQKESTTLIQKIIDFDIVITKLRLDFQDLKKSIHERLKNNEDRIEKLYQHCYRIEETVFNEECIRDLNTSLKKLSEESRDDNMKLAKRFDEVEENLRSLVKKEVEDQLQRDNLQPNNLQKLAQENSSKMQRTENTTGYQRFSLWSREIKSEADIDEDEVASNEKQILDQTVIQSPTGFRQGTENSKVSLKSGPPIRQPQRGPESLLEEQLPKEVNEYKPHDFKRKNKTEIDDKATKFYQSVSHTLQPEDDVGLHWKQLSKLQTATLVSEAEHLMSRVSILAADATDDQFIKIPIAAFSRDAAQLMSLESQLADDVTENQFIKIPIAPFSSDVAQLMSLDSQLAADVTENQFIKIPIAALSREAVQLMSLDSKLVAEVTENQFIKIPIATFSREAAQLIHLIQSLWLMQQRISF